MRRFTVLSLHSSPFLLTRFKRIMIKYPNIDPVFIRIGPLAFRWYGLMYALSFIAAIFIIRATAVRRGLKITKEEISDMMLYVAIGVILGGRLGYVLFYNLGFYLENPSKIFAVWEGGMSFHGGLIGVLVAGTLFCKRYQYSFYDLADVSAPAVPVGLGLGRIGNFINGELWGRPTDVPWCMVFPQADEACRHPSQLYQAALEGPVLFLILWVLSGRKVPRGVVFWSFFSSTVSFVLSPNSSVSPTRNWDLSSAPSRWGSSSACRCS
ncbi:MAG: prolipoprotein diacylglyceryl transferase [Candidatus Manganitrophus sp.]|nr:MAG: prolipoprotein diacylglyceryl transferase [Candidatus Manganitrophus sp.]